MLLATDEERAGAALAALVRLADDRGLHVTRGRAIKLLYLADLESIASHRSAQSGVLWRWWPGGPHCRSLGSVEDRLVATGVIKRSAGSLEDDEHDVALRPMPGDGAVPSSPDGFERHLEAVLERHGSESDGALAEAARNTVPMIEARRVGEAGTLLDMHGVGSDFDDLDAGLSRLADRPDLVVMPEVDPERLGAPDPEEIVGVFRGNRMRANDRLLAD